VKSWLLAAGAVEVGFLAVLGRQDIASTFPGAGLALFTGAFAAYGVAAWALMRGPDRNAAAPGSIVWIWAVGLVLRAVLLPLDPALSDDFFRYLWDGRVQLAGINPYLHAPASIALESLRTSWHGLINNPTVPTIYPPFAQLVFLGVAALGSKVWALKAIWLLCDLATGAIIVRIARGTGRRADAALLLYLWAPLLVASSARSAHLEP
jgi:hypothetical protein